jgi:hypothetical protein
VFAVMAVLGSVMWLKPSATQQRQARLRMLARQLGLDVRLAPLPQIRRARVRQQAADAGVVYRLLRFDIELPLRSDYLLVRDGADTEWEPQSADALPAAIQAALDAVLSQLPRDIVAVELTAHGPGVYWRERGDEETVRSLSALLTQLAQAMSAR